MRQYILILIALIAPNMAIAQAVRYDTPSHLPVPRFVSMRYDVVNARGGPDESYPIRFVYKQQGLPVKVTAETEEWRRIEDPDGAVTWVHRRNVDSRRTVMIKPAQAGATFVGLYNNNSENRRIIAKIAAGSICELLDSREGWRKIRISRFTGWIAANDAWAS